MTAAFCKTRPGSGCPRIWRTRWASPARWRNNIILAGPHIKHWLDSFGSVADYVGLRIHIARPINGGLRQLPVLTVQEPKHLKYAEKLATLNQRDPVTEKYVRDLICTNDLQQLTGQIVAAATTEIENLELCRPFWRVGQTVLQATKQVQRGPTLEGMHPISNDVCIAAKEIEHMMRFP